MTKLAHSIDDAAAMIGVSRSSLYNMIRSGTLATVKIAGRRLVPAESISRLLATPEA